MKFLTALRQLGAAAGAIALLGACQSTPTTNPATPAQPTDTSLRTYLTPPTASVQTGGVQVIPITTPKGKFNVWTKRIGNNPKIKVLLLSGGPGLSH